MPFEFTILEWINKNLTTNNFFNKIMRLFTFLGDKGFIWIIIGILLLCFKKSRRCGIVYFLVLINEHLLGEAIKNVCMRTRPIYVEGHEELLDFASQWLNIDKPLSYLFGLPKVTSFSFASGHTFSSFACATTLFIYNKKYGIAGYVLAFFIAFSRLFFSVHFPSDVLCGAIFGVVLSLFINKIFNKYSMKEDALQCA